MSEYADTIIRGIISKVKSLLDENPDASREERMKLVFQELDKLGILDETVTLTETVGPPNMPDEDKEFVLKTYEEFGIRDNLDWEVFFLVTARFLLRTKYGRPAGEDRKRRSYEPSFAQAVI